MDTMKQAKQTQDSWTLLAALRWTEQHLTRHGEQNARLSAQLLMAQATGLERIELYTNFDLTLSRAEREALRTSIQRRVAGEPLQYILGKAPFYHIDLAVTPDVLIPRPETESLVELVLGHFAQSVACDTRSVACDTQSVDHTVQSADPDHTAQSADRAVKNSSSVATLVLSQEPVPSLRLLEFGTGCGNIALTLARELEGCHIVATDISPAALSVARANAMALDLADAVEFVLDDFMISFDGAGEPGGQGCSSLCHTHSSFIKDADEFGIQDYSPVQDTSQMMPFFDAIVSNPPYIPSGLVPTLPPEVVDHEPLLALDGGSDGLDALRAIATRAVGLLAPGGLLALELHETSLDAAADYVRGLPYRAIEIHDDLNGRPRFLTATFEAGRVDRALRADKIVRTGSAERKNRASA